MEDFNSSLKFDKRLYKEDIKGSIAHVKMLSKCGILEGEEKLIIIDGLISILDDIENGVLKIEGDYEDIHSFIEINLINRVGDVGKKLHTGRSRNDQVAVDMRMYAKSITFEIIEYINELLEVIKNLAHSNDVIMPGYTHLQRAQVIKFKLHMMAY